MIYFKLCCDEGHEQTLPLDRLKELVKLEFGVRCPLCAGDKPYLFAEPERTGRPLPRINDSQFLKDCGISEGDVEGWPI